MLRSRRPRRSSSLSASAEACSRTRSAASHSSISPAITPSSPGPLMPSNRNSGGALIHSSSVAGGLRVIALAAAKAARPPPLWPATTIRPGLIAAGTATPGRSAGSCAAASARTSITYCCGSAIPNVAAFVPWGRTPIMLRPLAASCCGMRSASTSWTVPLAPREASSVVRSRKPALPIPWKKRRTSGCAARSTPSGTITIAFPAAPSSLPPCTSSFVLPPFTPVTGIRSVPATSCPFSFHPPARGGCGGFSLRCRSVATAALPAPRCRASTSARGSGTGAATCSGRASRGRSSIRRRSRGADMVRRYQP